MVAETDDSEKSLKVFLVSWKQVPLRNFSFACVKKRTHFSQQRFRSNVVKFNVTLIRTIILNECSAKSIPGHYYTLIIWRNTFLPLIHFCSEVAIWLVKLSDVSQRELRKSVSATGRSYVYFVSINPNILNWNKC